MSCLLLSYFLFCPVLLLTVQWNWFLVLHNATFTVESWEIFPTLRLLLLICNATVFVYFKIV